MASKKHARNYFQPKIKKRAHSVPHARKILTPRDKRGFRP